MSQSRAWSAAATEYESLFIDPYAPGTVNPLPGLLRKVPDAGRKVVADLGCGTGPLLPLLAETFRHVHAIDFAPGMLERARQRVGDGTNVTFHTCDLPELESLSLALDVAVAVNSLVLPDLDGLETTLAAIHASMKRGGRFFAVLPAMDGVQHHTMLLLDHFRAQGLPLEEARARTASAAEHELYDFTWSGFRYRGLDQHFWQREEVSYRLEKAGFAQVRLRKLRLAWSQLALGTSLANHPAPWDWLVQARRE
jgi:SAM-dependent methyltransferase